MTDLPPPSAPSGWYESPEDGLRYWDGSHWLAPAPENIPAFPGSPLAPLYIQDEAQRRRRLWPWFVAASVLVVVVGIFAGIGIYNQVLDSQERARVAAVQADRVEDAKRHAEIQRKREQADAELAAAAAATAARHTADMYDIGWSEFAPGLYYSWVDSEESTCDLFECLYVIVLAEEGCPEGLYVEASVLAGDLSVGFSNGVTAGLPVQGQAQLRLDDPYGEGHSFRMTDIHCRG